MLPAPAPSSPGQVARAEDGEPSGTRTRPLSSLQYRLPLAIGALLLVLVAVLALVAYYRVAAASREAAGERLELVTRRFSRLLTTQAERTGVRTDSVAAQAAFREFLRNPTAANEAAARQLLLDRVAKDEDLRIIRLRAPDGRPLLSAGPDTANTPEDVVPTLLGISAKAGKGTVGPFVEMDSMVLIPALAPVRDGNQVVGYLFEWWNIHTRPEQREALKELIGRGAELTFGSLNGVWTDQTRRLPQPPFLPNDTSTVVTYKSPAGGERLAFAATVPGTPWLVSVEYAMSEVLAPARLFLRDVAGISAALLLLGLLGVWLYTRRITVPLSRLAAAAGQLSEGNLSSRVHLQRSDELGRLGEAFDRMAARIQENHLELAASLAELRTTREQFVHMQRMEAVGRLAGGVAHDFNNMLSVILAETELAREALDQRHPAAESVASIRKVSERAASLTRQLLAFSRRQLVEPTEFSLNDLVGDMAPMLRRLLGERIELRCQLEAEEPRVRADRGQIEQVLLNLAVNARDAMPEGGLLVLETRNVTLDEEYAALRDDVIPGEYVMMAVSDTGTGIPQNVRARIFEPFFTTKERGRGTGLGLATCYGILKQHGGHIAVYSEAGVGSTFRTYLPAITGPSTAVALRPQEEIKGNETVLLVEDEPALRDVATRILVRQGYTVIPAASADEALERLDQDGREVNLLLTDVVLPGRGGRELAEEVQRRRPDIKVLYVTGYTEDVILQHRLMSRDVVLLQKPYTAETLGAKVREVLAGTGPA
jgi:signal transduction histidine kinase